MRIMVRGRQAGKTHELMRRFTRSENAILVVMDEISRKQLIRHYNVPEHRHKDIVTAEGIEAGVLRGRDPFSVVHIDNADWLIRRFLGTTHEVGTVTFTGTSV